MPEAPNNALMSKRFRGFLPVVVDVETGEILYKRRLAGSAPAAPAVSGIAPFLDNDQRHFQGQAGMRKDPTEVDHVMKQFQQAASLGAHPALHDATTAGGTFDQLLA